MRLKEDGSLDLDWRERRRRDPRAPLTEEDLEDMREELISVGLVHGCTELSQAKMNNNK